MPHKLSLKETKPRLVPSKNSSPGLPRSLPTHLCSKVRTKASLSKKTHSTRHRRKSLRSRMMTSKAANNSSQANQKASRTGQFDHRTKAFITITRQLKGVWRETETLLALRLTQACAKNWPVWSAPRPKYLNNSSPSLAKRAQLSKSRNPSNSWIRRRHRAPSRWSRAQGAFWRSKSRWARRWPPTSPLDKAAAWPTILKNTQKFRTVKSKSLQQEFISRNLPR